MKDKMNMLGKVGVLLGGNSAEREVSLKSGAAVLAALRSRGVDAHPYDPASGGLQGLEAAGFDRVFIALHGRGGEDGQMQGALSLLGIPYTGSGVLASALAMDKWRSKLMWQAAGLPVPEYARLTETSDFAAVEQQLGLPIFVKPANEGSSIGITKVKIPGALQAAWREAARYDDLVLAERELSGGEFTVGILAGLALPVIRIVPATEFYDYEAKYLRDDTRYLVPSGLPVGLEAEMQQLAQQAFAVLGCRGWGRVDILLDANQRPYVLEINTSPGMTDHSLVPMAARASGIEFADLCLQVLALAETEAADVA